MSRPPRKSTWPPLPARPADGNKGTFGRVLIIGGQATMLGAPLLSGRAALVCGSGLVQVIVPADHLAATLAAQPELLGGTQEDLLALAAALEKADAIAVGPGLGQRPAAEALLNLALATDKPAVIDADALNVLAVRPDWPTNMNGRVLTPHPGEMRRLLHYLPGNKVVPTEESGRIEVATSAATAWNCVVVLKGSRTVVAWPSGYAVNPTGDVSLAKSGTGDVLTGVIVSLMGQGLAPYEAAMAGVWVHGQAGENAGKELTQRAVLASDVITHLPGAFLEYGRRYGGGP